jgi:thiamine pyrophosphate-dependent acetolactate synthase large subunit-like protein
MDARKEGAPIIAIAGDVETSLIDTAALEELNPYKDRWPLFGQHVAGVIKTMKRNVGLLSRNV